MLTIQLSMTCNLGLTSLITRLEHDVVLAIEWFELNWMMLNQDKCHFLFSGQYETLFVNVEETKIWESKQQNLLCYLIDRDLKFYKYVLSQLKKKQVKTHWTHWDKQIYDFHKKEEHHESFYWISVWLLRTCLDVLWETN